jgi:hypothetical protein
MDQEIVDVESLLKKCCSLVCTRTLRIKLHRFQFHHNHYGRFSTNDKLKELMERKLIQYPLNTTAEMHMQGSRKREIASKLGLHKDTIKRYTTLIFSNRSRSVWIKNKRIRWNEELKAVKNTRL